MASKRRIRRRSCENKRAYTDREKAKNHMWHLRRTLGEKHLVVYDRKFGNHLHVGRRKKKFR